VCLTISWVRLGKGTRPTDPCVGGVLVGVPHPKTKYSEVTNGRRMLAPKRKTAGRGRRMCFCFKKTDPAFGYWLVHVLLRASEDGSNLF
jgi:hypothetical protein